MVSSRSSPSGSVTVSRRMENLMPARTKSLVISSMPPVSHCWRYVLPPCVRIHRSLVLSGSMAAISAIRPLNVFSAVSWTKPPTANFPPGASSFN